MKGEYTNATTTQLMDAGTKEWVPSFFKKLQIPLEMMPQVVSPGTAIGWLDHKLQKTLDLPPIEVICPATHDTASAVIGCPLKDGWAYLSSGTWSLIGIETEKPIIFEEALLINATNEGGAFNTNRFLKNVMGLWIFESCRKEWTRMGMKIDYQELEWKINTVPSFQNFIYPDYEAFFSPDSMLAAIAKFFEESGQAPVTDPVHLCRIIFESLALRYTSILEKIQDITDIEIKGVHIVGGGSKNEFLNQATSNSSGLPVQAGPVEATAIGNLLVQAIAVKRFPSLAKGREYIREHSDIKNYLPQISKGWKEAKYRYHTLEAKYGKNQAELL